MDGLTWFKEFPGAITVTDAEGIIVAMNEESTALFEGYGGTDLIGKNVLDCHSGDSRAKLEKMYLSPQKNVYTIKKNGQMRLIYQSPYFIEGKFAGLVELGLEIPDEIPHFNRDLE